MSHNLPPLPPDIQRVVDEESARPLPSAETLARVKGRLHASIAAGAVADLPPLPSARGLFTVARVVGSAVVLGALGSGAWLARGPVEPVVSIVVSPVATPAPSDAPRAEPVAAGAVVRVAVAEAEVAAASVPAPLPQRRRGTRTPAAPMPAPVAEDPPPAAAPEVVEQAEVPAPAETLVEEHAVLERARAHLQAARLEDARGALAEHGRRFPAGRLVEERLALEVVLLARAGDREAATRAADAFRAAHRRSLFQPMVDQALGR
ncbi:MAG: hypothetical protein HY904_07925 [Deltaproteobacteria bacterium]|nr:hypothetical protein [Deltaproteobacteria bacterium]